MSFEIDETTNRWGLCVCHEFSEYRYSHVSFEIDETTNRWGLCVCHEFSDSEYSPDRWAMSGALAMVADGVLLVQGRLSPAIPVPPVPARLRSFECGCGTQADSQIHIHINPSVQLSCGGQGTLLVCSCATLRQCLINFNGGQLCWWAGHSAGVLSG